MRTSQGASLPTHDGCAGSPEHRDRLQDVNGFLDQGGVAGIARGHGERPLLEAEQIRWIDHGGYVTSALRRTLRFCGSR
jgi:hypothetical protein